MSLKIVHLAIDEKFIDMAMHSFERIAPGCNKLILCASHPLKHVKSKAILVSTLQAVFGIVPLVRSCDVLVVHSLNPVWFSLIKIMNKRVRIIWLGWGYDYYDIIAKNKNKLFLPLTCSLISKEYKPRLGFFSRFKAFVKRLVMLSKNSVISNVDIFSPVLPIEYLLVRENFLQKDFPVQAVWNYGNLEDDLIRGFEGFSVCGDNILVGNSATAANNHLDSFEIIAKLSLDGRKIITPLSYGCDNYRRIINYHGDLMFGDKFNSLEHFMPISDYIETIRSCGFVVMNHLRQQAVGNIIIMLYLGAKVFLNVKCPTFRFLKENGAIIFSIDELVKNKEALNKGLELSQIEKNRMVVGNIWSKSVSDGKTKKLIDLAVSLKNDT
jgi:hypothetical protein